jgi:hypothetical protein
MRTSRSIPGLLDPAAGFEAKLRAFAREVARRHRGRPVDPKQMFAALRGYHRALAVVANVPALDDALTAVAVAEYLAARGARRPAAA